MATIRADGTVLGFDVGARRIGVADKAMAKVSNHAGTATLKVSVSNSVAAGSAWVERGYGATAPLVAGRVEVQQA